MHYLSRYTDSTTAASLPLPVSSGCVWEPISSGYQVRIDLPSMPANWIVVPSFNQIDQLDSSYQFTLEGDTFECPLPKVPSTPEAVPRQSPEQFSSESLRHAPRPGRAKPESTLDPPAVHHIDCIHTIRAIAPSTLLLRVGADAEPQRYWLSISARPLLINPTADIPVEIPALDVPARSQMTAPTSIRRHICSPTSIAMVLDYHGRTPLWPDFAKACKDPATGMYGVWPMGLREAGRNGCLSAVEVFSDWAVIATLLSAGLPVVASIRFDQNRLAGAPLPRSNGHLVVIRGLSRNEVLVNDPASPTQDQVARRYSISEFSDAWLAHRGAGYIILP